MKKIKRLVAVVMVAACLCCAMMTGCEKTPEVPAETEYKVSLKSYNGETVSTGVIAVFYKDGEQVAMQPCDAGGVATKTLATDAYTVKLQFTGGDTYFYHEDGLKVTAEEPNLGITLFAKASGEKTTIGIPQTNVDEWGLTTVTPIETSVYNLKEGATYVEVTPGEKTYFLFTPERGGIYELSVLEGKDCTFASYGNPNYIRETPTQEIVDGVCTINVENTSVTGDPDNTQVLVMAVESEAASNCIVRIERIGDPAWSVSQEEWIIYKTTAKLEQCEIAENVELKNFDLTKEYNIVFNKEDGLYHVGSETGSVVYVYLTRNPRFVDCFQTILENGSVRAYFYDDNGNFVKKEAYGTCLKEYFEYVDAQRGVYPLTGDLMYIIQSFGDRQGWWNRDSKGFIVDVNGLVEESGWLFMCCYGE